MRFDAKNVARAGSSRDEALRDDDELNDDVMDRPSEAGSDEQQARQESGHGCGGVGAKALARTNGHAGSISGCGAQQRSDVARKDFRCHIDEQGLANQARHVFQAQSVLDALERFLDAPALVLEAAEDIAWEAELVVGAGEHAYESDGGSLAPQTHAPRRVGASDAGPPGHAAAFKVDPMLLAAADYEEARRDPDFVIVAAYDETNASHDEKRDQPSPGIAAVKHQHVVGTQTLQSLEQHLALAENGTLHARVQGKFGARQIKREQSRIALCGWAAPRMTAAYRKARTAASSATTRRSHHSSTRARKAHGESVVEFCQRVGPTPEAGARATARAASTLWRAARSRRLAKKCFRPPYCAGPRLRSRAAIKDGNGLKTTLTTRNIFPFTTLRGFNSVDCSRLSRDYKTGCCWHVFC